MTPKTILRQEIRDQLEATPPEARRLASIAINETLANWIKETRPRAVAAFYPLRYEPDIVPTLKLLLKKSKLLLPRLANGALVFHEVQDLEIEMIPGPYGTREPNPTMPVPNLVYLDGILVPGMAFTEDGARLGRGGGFYDRLLEKIRPELPRIGIAFASQIVEELPLEPHDERVSRVIWA